MSLDGRGAVVTGGGRGIGAAVARALAREGAAVVVAARTLDQVERVAAELRESEWNAWAVVCDVTRPESVRELARGAIERLGHVDILVNNAGVAHSAPLHKITLEDWNRLFAVNATGTFLCTQAFVPGMLERKWGRVVNVASVSGLTGARYIAAYAASKHAVLGFTRAVAAEVALQGVTVNAVCPGYVDTDLTRESVERIVRETGRTREQALQALLERTPQRRLIEPEEVAHAVLALCDELAKGVNGEAIVIDGGALLA
ncbi:MAG TPA: SDR family NAD(P)-dependent oxidoreductase [Gemmatimonadota bacterium]|jgi:3-hydroxybutyrate dehydrogenase